MTLGNSLFPAGERVGQRSRLECFCVTLVSKFTTAVIRQNPKKIRELDVQWPQYLFGKLSHALKSYEFQLII